jgi:hypothetical protein
MLLGRRLFSQGVAQLGRVLGLEPSGLDLHLKTALTNLINGLVFKHKLTEAFITKV